MFWALFQLACIQCDDISQCAGGIRLCAAEDRVALWMLGALETVFPARARVEDDALVEPLLSL